MAFESGQPVCEIDTAAHFCRRPTASSAARQCAAWLSPTSATVGLTFGVPKLQT